VTETDASVLVDLAGWVLLAVTLLLPLVSRDCRGDRRIAYVIWVGIVAHQALALWTAYLTGLSSDAGDMHLAAVQRLGHWNSSLSIGGYFYIQLLGAAYEVLAPSSFLGQQLSILAYALSCLVFVRLLAVLGVDRNRWVLLALYALPLSMLRYTSTTIREAYQILFLTLAIYWAIRYKRQVSVLAFALSTVSAIAAGIFHDGLIVYSIFLVGLIIVWPMGSGSSSGSHSRELAMRRLLLAVPLTLAAAWGAYRVIGGTGGGLAIQALTSRRALEYAARYREGGLTIDARTTYQVRLNTSSLPALVASLGPVFVYYMFTPFPWQIRSLQDVYGAAEALLRFLLLIYAVQEWRRSAGERRRLIGLLLVAYFSLAFLWSLGTVNYGTASRHHLTTTWILLVVGGPRLLHAAARWTQIAVAQRRLARA
jgi:hypothetical protein